MDEDVIDYINNSTYRVKVVKSIDKGVKIPKEISKDSGILQNHISNVLRELKEKNVVECINPEVKKGRLYRLTDDGLDMLDKIE